MADGRELAAGRVALAATDFRATSNEVPARAGVDHHASVPSKTIAGDADIAFGRGTVAGRMVPSYAAEAWMEVAANAGSSIQVCRDGSGRNSIRASEGHVEALGGPSGGVVDTESEAAYWRDAALTQNDEVIVERFKDIFATRVEHNLPAIK